MVDYHIHTKLCGHAFGEVKEYCQQAVEVNLHEIGFSDHFPMNYQPAYSHDIKTITMREEEISSYLDMIDLTSKDMKIKKGFEVDYYPGENLFFTKYLSLYDKLDYIIGSVHFVDEMSVDQVDYKSQVLQYGRDRLWSDYFNKITEMIEKYSNYIDIIAHLDLPKKVIGAVPDQFLEKIDKILKIIKDKKLVIEANTSGWDNAGDLYPSEKIIKMIFNYGIEMTLSSDAHHPLQVGRYFNKAKTLLQDIGFKKVISFNNHKKENINL